MGGVVGRMVMVRQGRGVWGGEGVISVYISLCNTCQLIGVISILGIKHRLWWCILLTVLKMITVISTMMRWSGRMIFMMMMMMVFSFFSFIDFLIIFIITFTFAISILFTTIIMIIFPIIILHQRPRWRRGRGFRCRRYLLTFYLLRSVGDIIISCRSCSCSCRSYSSGTN